MSALPRIILLGDTSEAARWVGVAKKFARVLAASHIPSRQWDVGTARIYIETHSSKISKIIIIGVGKPSPFLSFVWIPEGILLTPHSVSAPYGYGPPRRRFDDGALINPPFGTRIEGGFWMETLNQCLINQFENNKYLDRKGFVENLPKLDDKDKGVRKLAELIDKELTEDHRRAASIDENRKSKVPFICYAPVVRRTLDENYSDAFWRIYENQVKWPTDPGIQKFSGGLRSSPLIVPPKPGENEPQEVDLEWRQFEGPAYDAAALIYEEEDLANWYCHWPEELLYDCDAYEEIYQYTNRLRTAVGRKPLIRELRGFANPARLILQEMQRAKVQMHDSEKLYRPGYKTLDSRVAVAGLNQFRSEENLVSGLSGGRFSKEIGRNAAIAWRHSPPHYAAMVSKKWDEILCYGTSLDVFGGTSQITAESGPPYPGTFDPPLTGRAYAQLFTQRQQWLFAGYLKQESDYGRTSVSGSNTPACSLLNVDTSGVPWQVCYQGRAWPIKPVADVIRAQTHDVSTFGSTLFYENGVLFFRVITFLVPKGERWGEGTIASYRHAVGQWDDPEWTLEDSFIPKDRDFDAPCSSVTFSPDGRNGIFSIIKNTHDFAPTAMVGTWSYAPGSMHTRTSRTTHAHIQVIDGIFSTLTVLDDVPSLTYTVNRPGPGNELMTFRQQGSGTVEDLWPAYNEAGDLVSVSLDFEIDCYQKNGKSADNLGQGGIPGEFIYTSITTLRFSSGKTVNIESVKVNEIQRIEDDYVFAEAAHISMVLYLNVVTEEIIYLKYNLTSEPYYFEGYPYQCIFVTPELYINDKLMKTWDKEFLNGIYWTLKPNFVGYFESDPPDTGSYSGIRPLGLRNSVVAKDIGFDNWLTHYLTVPPGVTSLDSITYKIMECEARSPDIFWSGGDPIIGTFKISLGARTEIGQHCISGVHDGVQWQAVNYDPLFNIPVAGNTFPMRSMTNVAHYKDRWVSSVLLREVFGYTFDEPSKDYYGVWDANFDLEGLVGLSGLDYLLPLGVV